MSKCLFKDATVGKWLLWAVDRTTVTLRTATKTISKTLHMAQNWGGSDGRLTPFQPSPPMTTSWQWRIKGETSASGKSLVANWINFGTSNPTGKFIIKMWFFATMTQKKYFKKAHFDFMVLEQVCSVVHGGRKQLPVHRFYIRAHQSVRHEGQNNISRGKQIPMVSSLFCVQPTIYFLH